jgi:hypothetical protein
MTAIEPDWAESVATDCVTGDGSTGFVLRLARYPARGVSWLWLHVLLPDDLLGYNDDTLALTGFQGATPVHADDVTYELPGQLRARLRRIGPRSAVIGAVATVRAPTHRDPHARIGSGDQIVQIDASFRPAHAPVARHPTRMEVLGDVRATIRVANRSVEVVGRGHCHEQHGPRPRFAGAFTYLTLRGARLSLVATKTRVRDSGFVVRGGRIITITGIEIDPPGLERRVRLQLDDGDVIDAVARVTHAFSVAVEGRRRPATAVMVDTPYGPLSGLINDWQPE